ncbi:MAG: hypothetical protein ABSF09_06865 [Candidatus Bathyarchaeia archaeon]
MTLEGVWEVLRNGQWESKRTLSWASGMDDTRLGRIIDFLERWHFTETRNAPDLQVRRKPGAISPVEVITLLRSIAKQSPWIRRRLRLAERVACRACGGRNFNFLGNNQVECPRCHEKQWYTIEIKSRSYQDENSYP